MTLNPTTLFLHAGRHKTGTTSLQHFFVLNEALLRSEYGLLYPQTGRIRNYHHGLFLDQLNEGKAPDTTLYNDLKSEIAESGASRVLLSSETLSRPSVTAEQLCEIASALAPLRPKVIIYLRRQDDYAESIYSEIVKNGNCRFPQTIHKMHFGLDYAAFLDKFATAFGAGNLIVRRFVKRADFSIYEDFMAAMGEPWNDSLTLPESYLNTRLPWIYTEALRIANCHPMFRRMIWNDRVKAATAKMQRRFPAMSGWCRPLSARQKKQLMQNYRASNQEVSSTYLDGEPLFAERD